MRSKTVGPGSRNWAPRYHAHRATLAGTRAASRAGSRAGPALITSLVQLHLQHRTTTPSWRDGTQTLLSTLNGRYRDRSRINVYLNSRLQRTQVTDQLITPRAQLDSCNANDSREQMKDICLACSQSLITLRSIEHILREVKMIILQLFCGMFLIEFRFNFV